MKSLVTISILALFVLISVGGAWGAEYIRYGLITALSGSGAMWGELSTAGVDQAIEDINSKGGITVKGKQYLFKGITYDSKFKADLAVAGTNKLIFSDKVSAFACMGTSPCLATVPMGTENKVIQFQGGYVKELLGPYSFKCMGSREFYLALFPFLQKHHPKAKKVALIAKDDDSGKGAVTNCKAAIRFFPELKLTHVEYYTPGTIDFSSVVMKVLREKPEVLNLDTGPAEDQGALIKAARQLGFKGPIMGDVAMDPVRIMEVAGKEYAEGYFYPAMSLDPTSPYALPAHKEMWDKCVAKYGEKKALKVYSGMYGFYVMVEVYAKAVEGAQSFDPDKLVKYMETHDFDCAFGKTTIKGEITYGIKRQIIHPMAVEMIKDGKPFGSEPMPLPKEY
jgi:branched-chain amino acid transport system substrate-binding protein